MSWADLARAAVAATASCSFLTSAPCNSLAKRPATAPAMPMRASASFSFLLNMRPVARRGKLHRCALFPVELTNSSPLPPQEDKEDAKRVAEEQKTMAAEQAILDQEKAARAAEKAAKQAAAVAVSEAIAAKYDLDDPKQANKARKEAAASVEVGEKFIDPVTGKSIRKVEKGTERKRPKGDKPAAAKRPVDDL